VIPNGCGAGILSAKARPLVIPSEAAARHGEVQGTKPEAAESRDPLIERSRSIGGRSSRPTMSAVHVLPMPDAHHRDEQLLAVKPIQHSVLSHAQPSQPLPLSGERLTRERIFE